MTRNADDFAEMALSLHQEPTFEDTVERVLEFALKAVDCTHAGVVFVGRNQRIETVAPTHPVVENLDRLQSELGEGPDITAGGDRDRTVIDDTRADTRWPRWAAAAADAGIRSMLGVRLYANSTSIGNLNLYDGRPQHFSNADRQVAHVLARHAAIALDTKQDSENLWRAIDARKIIGQAQGILMERYDLDANQAFALLRRYSQDHNVKLHDVALRLIDSRTLPKDDSRGS